MTFAHTPPDPEAEREIAALTAALDAANKRAEEAEAEVARLRTEVAIAQEAERSEAWEEARVASRGRAEAIARAEEAEAEVVRVTADRDSAARVALDRIRELMADLVRVTAEQTESLALYRREVNLLRGERDAAIAEAAALREAHERDERVVCRHPHDAGLSGGCNGTGEVAAFPGTVNDRRRCPACSGTGTVRAPLPDPSPAVAALIAAREACDQIEAAGYTTCPCCGEPLEEDFDEIEYERDHEPATCALARYEQVREKEKRCLVRAQGDVKAAKKGVTKR